MKQIIESYVREDGSIEPKHEIDVVCSNCQDQISQEEEQTGLCTNCGQPWSAQQNVKVFTTTLPAIDGLTITIG
jgi:predicted amidophosphoribosyltransferase